MTGFLGYGLFGEAWFWRRLSWDCLCGDRLEVAVEEGAGELHVGFAEVLVSFFEEGTAHGVLVDEDAVLHFEVVRFSGDGVFVNVIVAGVVPIVFHVAGMMGGGCVSTEGERECERHQDR